MSISTVQFCIRQSILLQEVGNTHHHVWIRVGLGGGGGLSVFDKVNFLLEMAGKSIKTYFFKTTRQIIWPLGAFIIVDKYLFWVDLGLVKKRNNPLTTVIIYRLEIQSVMMVFSTQLCEMLPLEPPLWFNFPPLPFPVRISIVYTRIQCVRKGIWGSGPQTDKTSAAKSLYR